MIFNIKIVLHLIKKIAITEKPLSLIITNIKYTKNIFFKIIYSYLIAKLNDIVDFYSNKYKIVTIIFKLIIKNSN